MKKYISANERKDIVAFIISIGIGQSIIDRTQDTSSYEEKRRIGMINNHIEKYIKAVIHRVGDEEGGRLKRYLGDSQVEVKTRSSVVADGKYKNFQKEDVLDLCEDLIKYKCLNCTDKKYHQCRMYNLMQDLEVWMVAPNIKLCPYSYVNESEEDNE